ncbi:hypothetical protein BD847_0025 [Flavobacterium cutihirudinis]|uniref:Type II secretion system protein GspC N-terminal domain-containing protein n=1 Tax=Flavobacterium cutihirudinis TaxID=1265740 RepID=A0A3D9FYZ5_9FLAO|nr:hypothetical protein [Flavobacterium cutihirudinis]RED26119.1 hypothetical protein BD847_0025 [Flavobacterium cutihirudinis]
MKNKKNIYILLPLVLLVWGAVIFQFFSFTKVDEMIPDSNHEFTIKPLKISNKDSFPINVNYRDPFLGKLYNSETASSAKRTSLKKIKVSKETETLIWPNIVYKGLISDTKGKNKIFMLIIDSKNYYMKIGDTENEIFLKSGDQESIYVKYKGNLNIIMLQD